MVCILPGESTGTCVELFLSPVLYCAQVPVEDCSFCPSHFILWAASEPVMLTDSTPSATDVAKSMESVGDSEKALEGKARRAVVVARGQGSCYLDRGECLTREHRKKWKVSARRDKRGLRSIRIVSNAFSRGTLTFNRLTSDSPRTLGPSAS